MGFTARGGSTPLQAHERTPSSVGGFVVSDACGPLGRLAGARAPIGHRSVKQTPSSISPERTRYSRLPGGFECLGIGRAAPPPDGLSVALPRDKPLSLLHLRPALDAFAAIVVLRNGHVS